MLGTLFSMLVFLMSNKWSLVINLKFERVLFIGPTAILQLLQKYGFPLLSANGNHL